MMMLQNASTAESG